MDVNNNRLEELMKIDPKIMTIEEQNMFLDELKKSELYMPIEIVSDSLDFTSEDVGKTLNLDEPLKFKPVKIYDSNDNVILPLFTSSENFKNSQIDSSSILMHTEDLYNMLNDGRDDFDEIMINPSTETSINIDIDSFLDLFAEDMFDVLYGLFKLFEEKATPLEDDYNFYLREKTPFMKDNSVDDVFSSQLPLTVSRSANFNKNYPYLNILVLKEGMKVLYIGNIVNPEENYDTILYPNIKFRFLKYIDEYTLLWESFE